MYPNPSYSVYRRIDLLRDAERQRLGRLVTCCAESPLFRGLNRLASAITERVAGRGETQPEAVCCGA